MVITIFSQNCSTWKIPLLHHLALLFCKQCNMASNHSENLLIVPNIDFDLVAFLMPSHQSGGRGHKASTLNKARQKSVRCNSQVDRPNMSMTPGIPDYSQSSVLNKPYQCAKCNALSLTPGYGRMVGNSVVLDPLCLKHPKEFNIEVFIYFVRQMCIFSPCRSFVLPWMLRGPHRVFDLLSSLVCQFSHQGLPPMGGPQWPSG